MKKKAFISLLLISLFAITACSYAFAATGAGNAVMNVGNSVGNAATGVTNAVVDGARNLGNGVSNLANDMTNANGDTESDATNTNGETGAMLDNNDDNYTATRTAANDNNMLGMSDTTWTWLILGIIGLTIVGLVWYYGAQYEHRNYNND